MNASFSKRALRAAVILTGAASAYVTLLAAPAAAQEDIMIHGVRPELHVGVGWGAQLGVGARADIPIVPRGLIDGVNDELAISPGAELYFHDDRANHFAIAPLVAAQWNFYVSPSWSLFPELGLALIFDQNGGNHVDHVHLNLLFALGARYHFTSRNAFIIRVVWPFGLQLGITF